MKRTASDLPSKKADILEFAKVVSPIEANNINGGNDMKNPVADLPLAKFEEKLLDLCIINSSSSRAYTRLLCRFFKNGGRLRHVDFENYIPNLVLNTWQNDVLYYYCKNVKKGRLSPELEAVIFSSAYNRNIDNYGYKMARYVVRGRYLEYEKVCKNFRYVEFLKSKGLEVEDILMNSPSLAFYFYKYYHYLPDNVHNFMVAMSLTTNLSAKRYFKIRSYDDQVIKNRLKLLDQTKTVAEVIESMRSLGK